MDAKDWLILKTLSEQGSITKASKSLFITQPALSKRIQQIEEEFKTSIILRSNKGIVFTPEGEYLVTYSNEMLSKLQEAKDILKNMDRNSVHGTLKIGVPNRFAHKVLPEIISSFSMQYPNIHVHIKSGYTNKIIEWHKQKEIQIAFIRGKLEGETIIHHLISRDNIYLISKNKIDIEALPDMPRIIYQTDPSLHSFLDEWWEKRFTKPMTIGMDVGDSQTCIQMVKQGLGYAIVPGYCLNHPEYDLYTRPLYNHNDELLMRNTFMVYDKELLRLTTIQKFVAFIENHYQLSIE